MEFEYLHLSSEVKNFLIDYTPEDDMITSVKEMDLIKTSLNLSNLDGSELHKLRNSVVDFYSNLENKELIYDENGKFIRRTEKFWRYNTSIQSVTAVIDHYMYSIGRTDLI